jgi:hypothetical protein
MDNRRLDITSQGEKALAIAMEIAWPGAAGGHAKHYKLLKLKPVTNYYGDPVQRHNTEQKECEDGISTLLLLWHEERGSQPLPYELSLPEAIGFVSGWLKRADFGAEPGHDGSNGKGFRAFTEAWGHVYGHHYAIVAVQPAWALYGK